MGNSPSTLHASLPGSLRPSSITTDGHKCGRPAMSSLYTRRATGLRQPTTAPSMVSTVLEGIIAHVPPREPAPPQRQSLGSERGTQPRTSTLCWSVKEAMLWPKGDLRLFWHWTSLAPSTMWHDAMLERLCAVKVGKVLLELLCNYLQEWHMWVAHKGQQSSL